MPTQSPGERFIQVIDSSLGLGVYTLAVWIFILLDSHNDHFSCN